VDSTQGFFDFRRWHVSTRNATVATHAGASAWHAAAESQRLFGLLQVVHI
jgi:hypothetical protein